MVPMSPTSDSDRTADEGDGKSSRQSSWNRSGRSADVTEPSWKRHREAKRHGEDDTVQLQPDATALFGDGEQGGRGVGASTTQERLDKGLPSKIGKENRDAYGRELSGTQRHRANRLRQWQRRSHQNGSRDRSLKYGLDEIRRMGTALGTSKDIRSTGSRLYRQAAEEDLLIGRSIEGIASACLYIGARTMGFPRSFDEVAQVSRVSRDRIVTCYTAVRDAFELSLTPVDPTEYLPRVVSEVAAEPHVERTARAIIQQAQAADGETKSIIGGTNPTSVVAAAVYAAAVHEGAGLTQAAIAKAANVHVSTIRNNYQDFLEEYRMNTGDSDDGGSQ